MILNGVENLLLVLVEADVLVTRSLLLVWHDQLDAVVVWAMCCELFRIPDLAQEQMQVFP